MRPCSSILEKGNAIYENEDAFSISYVIQSSQWSVLITNEPIIITMRNNNSFGKDWEIGTALSANNFKMLYVTYIRPISCSIYLPI